MRQTHAGSPLQSLFLSAMVIDGWYFALPFPTFYEYSIAGNGQPATSSVTVPLLASRLLARLLASSDSFPPSFRRQCAAGGS